MPTDGTPVMGANAIVAATERATSPPAEPAPAASALPTTAAPTGAPPTVVPSGAPEPAPPTVSPAEAAPVASTPGPKPPTVVRPPTTPTRPTVTAHHSQGADLEDVAQPALDLVPLSDVVKPPPPPTWFFAAAGVLAVLALILALIGLAVPSGHGTLHAGSVTVAKTDPVNGGTVKVDLSKPVPVVVTSAGPPADHVTLASSVLGQQVSSTTALLKPFGTLKVASADLGGRYLIGGSFTGTVTLLQGGRSVGYWTFPAKTTQFGLISLPGAVTVLLLLFSIAYAESLLRSLRRGKRKVGGTVGLTLVGAVFGIALVGVAWVLARTEPTAASLVVCAILGAGAGLLTALGGVRIGRRRRFRRSERRKDKAATVGAGAR